VNRTRLAFLLAGAAGTVLLASGCAAGQNAATLQVKPDYAAGQANLMMAQDIVVVVDPTTGAAQLTGTVYNGGTDSDQLTSVTIGGHQVPLALPVAVDGKSSVNLAKTGGPQFVIAKQSGLTPGIDSSVDLSFASAGSIQLTAQVEANSGIYGAFQPSSSSAPAS
jgi:hypothetical protein